ncbi:hypothetical protein KQX54_020288 [Cotesia glomerata]|uniref:Uncharacterized protein n=1 Tax=Cotesia glomerata TaxID=32391 RepID=A0AAV7HZG5_COTGL|nr:hypothetical protein KQX54_020288 [Cotesia glomerata]
MSTDETVALLSGDNETVLELDNEILPVTNVTDEGYDVTYVLPNSSSIFEVNATTEIDSFYFYEMKGGVNFAPVSKTLLLTRDAHISFEFSPFCRFVVQQIQQL